MSRSHQPEQSFPLKRGSGDKFQCPLGVMCDTGDVLPGASSHREDQRLQKSTSSAVGH